MIKKFTALILSAALLFSFASCGIRKEKTTTLTNVVACINNYPIDAYLIDDELYVEVDNLLNYGFDVTQADNVYNIVIGEKEMTPKYNVKYYSEKELKGKGKVYKASTAKAVLHDKSDITGYEVEGKFCIPFSALTSIANGYENKDDVKKIIVNSLKGMGNANEYLYPKLRAKALASEEYFKLTFEEIKNVLGKEFTKETEDSFTVISYDSAICSVKMYFTFSDKDSEKDLDGKKVQKISTSNPNVTLMDAKVIGLNISDIEKMVDNKINVRDDENLIYATYNYYKNYNMKFILDANKKITSFEVEIK